MYCLSDWALQYEPRHEKTCLWGFRPGKTQTSLLSYRDKLESWNFGLSKYRYYTVQAANIKGADQTAQVDLRLCCSHVALTSFLMTWLIFQWSLQLFKKHLWFSGWDSKLKYCLYNIWVKQFFHDEEIGLWLVNHMFLFVVHQVSLAELRIVLFYKVTLKLS